ncbi:MAG TPA: glucose 1-dehydrogenase [Puia sp.]|nr:glucose 1-dehydrogenase [Puia sp.]
MPASKRLLNKVAIITGAANGIGLSISEAFVKEGANIVMADIDERKCKSEATRLAKHGTKVLAYFCDVALREDILALTEATIKAFGRIDILVNNAAVAIDGNIMDMPENRWDRLMDTNLKSVFRTIQAVLPFMVAEKSGAVINLSSTQAFRSWDNWTAYAAAKGAICSMTTQLAGQFGKDNIRFNTISPGAIMTPMNEQRAKEEGPDFLSKSAAMHALLRLGTPGEVAMTAVFLASDEAGFISGADIRVDGGLSVLPRFFE